MKRNYLVKAFVCLFTVAALCSCGEDEKDAPKSKECEIISFAVDGVAWHIDGANITRAYPAETEATDFTPAIGLSPGATVNPPANEAKNFFTAPGVTYTVTAEDGATTKTYLAKATVEDDNESGAIPNNTIAVVVENGDGFNDKIDLVKAEIPSGNGDENNVILATAAYENGRFTITLPESLGAQYLYDWAHDLREIPACITVSNPNVKINSTMNLIAYKSDARTGTIRYDVEGWKIFLVYVDGDVSITGSCTAEYTDGEGTFIIRYNYNAHLKTGWNIMYQKETVKTDNSREYELTTIVPNPSLAEKGTIVCPPPGFVPDNDIDDEDSWIPNNILAIVIENSAACNGIIDNVKTEIIQQYRDENGSLDYFFITLASAPYRDGGFTLTLPESVDNRYLDEWSIRGWNLDSLSNKGFSVSNYAKTTNPLYTNGYQSNSRRSSITHQGIYFSITESLPMTMVGDLIYVDRDLSITGTHRSQHYYESEDIVTNSVVKYSVYLKKGWNIIYEMLYQPDQLYKTHEFVVTTKPPEGAKWYYGLN